MAKSHRRRRRRTWFAISSGRWFFYQTDPCRSAFRLPVGAAFTAVANIIAIGALLPRAEGFILADMMNAVGLATIFLTLAQSAISLYSFATLLTLIGSGIIVVMEMLACISIPHTNAT